MQKYGDIFDGRGLKKEGNQTCHHFAGLIALDTLDVRRWTSYVEDGRFRWDPGRDAGGA